MNRIGAVLGALALGLGATACARPTPPDGALDVVLITIDTLRADHLGSYGFGLSTSPNIDALARSGVVFDRAIAAASTTAPAHASIMTSRYTREHSVGWKNGTSRLERAPTLAERFRAAGYRTAGFVGNLMLQRRLGFDRGFEVYDDELPTAERNRARYFERVAEQTTGRALAWLASVEGPFFLWVHYQDPHGPYTPPAPFAERFRVEPEAGEQPLPVLDNDYGLSGIPAYQVLPGLSLPSQYRGLYAGEIGYADHWVGELLRAADARQPDRLPVVLLTADHGESMGEAYRYFAHGHSTTPQVAHVPMILRAPGLAPGRRGDPVNHVDVMPTLLELAGLAAPPDLRGLALGPFLREARPLPERTVYCDIGRELSAYRSGGFVRVKGTGGAWDGAQHGGEPVLSWESYAWDGGSRWSRTPIDRSAKDPIRAYARRAVPMAEAAPIAVEDIELLRELGYEVAE